MALERCPFSLREVIFEALTSLAFGAAAKNIDVFFEIHPAVPDLVLGDGSRLGQVIKNLVGCLLVVFLQVLFRADVLVGVSS